MRRGSFSIGKAVPVPRLASLSPLVQLQLAVTLQDLQIRLLEPEEYLLPVHPTTATATAHDDDDFHSDRSEDVETSGGLAGQGVTGLYAGGLSIRTSGESSLHSSNHSAVSSAAESGASAETRGHADQMPGSFVQHYFASYLLYRAFTT